MAEKKQNGCFVATGRRKKSIARVRMSSGSGKIEVNGRNIDEYLQRDTLILIAKQPLAITSTADKFDIVANVDLTDIDITAKSQTVAAKLSVINRNDCWVSGDYKLTLK